MVWEGVLGISRLWGRKNCSQPGRRLPTLRRMPNAKYISFNLVNFVNKLLRFVEQWFQCYGFVAFCDSSEIFLTFAFCMISIWNILCHVLIFSSTAQPFIWFSCFSYLCTKIWNSLPPHILQSQTLSSFRRHLKTHYFQSAYPAPCTHPQYALILFWDFGAIPGGPKSDTPVLILR